MTLPDLWQQHWDTAVKEARAIEADSVFCGVEVGNGTIIAVDEELKRLRAVERAGRRLNSMWHHFGPESNFARQAFDELSGALRAALAADQP